MKFGYWPFCEIFVNPLNGKAYLVEDLAKRRYEAIEVVCDNIMVTGVPGRPW